MGRDDDLQKIRDLLATSTRGLTIGEVSDRLSLNRATAAKYLNSLVLSGQADLRELGRSKIFSLSRRAPISSVLNLLEEQILILDEELFITEVNDALLTHFRLPREALLGKRLDHSRLNAFFPRDLYLMLEQGRDGRVRTGEIASSRGRQRSYFRVRYIPMVGGDGKRGVVVILEDITAIKLQQAGLEVRIAQHTRELAQTNARLRAKIAEHRRTLSALGTSEEQYRRIVETSGEGIWIVDRRSRITFTNRRMCGMVGYTEEELSGMKYTDFLFPADRQDHAVMLARRKQGHADTYERRLVRRDGSTCWTRISVIPILDERGRYSASFAMITDISREKQLESELAALRGNKEHNGTRQSRKKSV